MAVGSSSPAGTAASSLTSVSCTSAARCIAVGDHGTRTLAEAWNGTRWRILTTPALASSSLAAVSRTGAARCIAVGDRGTRTLAEAWNGARWRLLNTRSPARSSLTSVSCTAAGCMAVGGHAVHIHGLPQTFIPRGHSPRRGTAQAGGSCRSRTCREQQAGRKAGLNQCRAPVIFRCMAVGGSSQVQGEGAFPSFAEVWDGISWHLLKVPALRSLVNGPGLTGVSCPLASRCVAAGSYFAAASLRIVAEAWNGAMWREMRPLNP
jgi:hypothetical protein